MNGLSGVLALGALVALILGSAFFGPPAHVNPLLVAPNGMVVDSAAEPRQIDGSMSITGALKVGAGDDDITVLRSQGFHGRCPVCESKDQVSIVYKGWCTSTLLATYAWYDTAGNYHFSDPNVTTCEHRCSVDHVFRVIFTGTEELILRPDGTPLR